ncbi:MAG: hypothetical protein A3A96_01670 [Candidatus Zambryskibacteria bacterium RIFCSPLOWO2_01_FULL_39_39]|uniref:Uncharacterized protein n=1 Tax=Candidatus Zambryskibacteria bacterium RIFCSPLOWO2_01_FULL_39_39 TaxID=1802758 RepID=A0A1G2TW38_9BACT|nr:MAG: hypothetical protein UT00_C0011G0017 [Parcubacteria group bacterium GW2011_GWA1_38_7]OHA94268.1 MAG: hypothetical protein A3B88_03925 [Candidatus Zambryskibacteria bacterium RIFCSPHIGHO2_02_FULL_39_19]OHA98465.1 MAG: hypothetical protein A3F20_03570 [Candidatus Zambryskibacteria bacterium RIFCSPHIGHO2_12_FULL_39_21]OHB01383.1 MAG: hypothetical protein A3A96_01670 [Candidatus Zambryskibacteria bacterium RIFCSPLOWO2_01_FULL_39_39]
MRKLEMREVETGYCDFCKEKASHLKKCAICKREMCGRGGYSEHSAYGMEVYRYGDANRLVSSHICKECVDKSLTITVGELFEGILGPTPIQL